MLILFDHGTPRGLGSAIVVLKGTMKWSRVQLHLERVAAVINTATPGSYTEVKVPFS